MSVVVPPGANSACPGGRVFVAYGDNYGASRLQSDDLACYISHAPGCFAQKPPTELGAEKIALTAAKQWDGKGKPSDFDCKPLFPLQTMARHQGRYTDAVMTRVGQNDLVHGIRGGLLHAYLVLALHPAAHPVPNRLTYDPALSCSNPYVTVGLAIAQSNDCGATWVKKSVFDLNDPAFFPADWAVPEYADDGTQNGGYDIDRPEIYADPYSLQPSKIVYLTAAIRLGSQAGKTVVLKSLTGGDSWEPPVLLPGAPNKDGQGRALGLPTVITTTPNHRVYAFRCEGATPTLYWSDWPEDNGTFSVQRSMTFKYGGGPDKNHPIEDIDCAVADSANLAAGVGAGSPAIGIARWGVPASDSVVVTYSGVRNKKQVQAVMLVASQGAKNKAPQATSSLLLQNAQSSIVQATLVQTDRFEFAPDEANDPQYDAAMLYWLEIPSSNGSASTAKYMTLRHGLIGSDVQQLSWKNGTPDSWTWRPAKTSIGDYNRGGFFFANVTGDAGKSPALHFVATWPQSRAGTATNISLHSNMVSWPRK